MDVGRPNPIADDLLKIALARQPKASTASAGQESARRELAEFLDEAELLNIGTVGAHGWPVTHCMHFATYFEEGDRPVVYMFTHEGKRKLTNIAANPRVSLTIFNGRQEAGDSMPYLQMEGLAHLATDQDERNRAMHGQFNKKHYEFARHLGLETQPAIRVDVISARWQDGRGGAPVEIDYRPFLGGRA